LKKIAFFDFDGTITTRDTMLAVIKFQKGVVPFYIGFLMNAPVLIGLKTKRVTNQAAKERILEYFFAGTAISSFQALCDFFAVNKLPALIRPKAMAEITSLQESGFEVVVVSASAENWVKAWCTKAGVKLIATKLELKDDALTGKISGINCHGEEKVLRIKSEYDLSKYGEIYCYGDTSGDKPMLALGTKSFYKPFR
jgi:phosphatidylglycerophosphatase C